MTRPYVKRASAADLLTHPFIATVVKQLEANEGRSELLRELVEREKSRILQYRNADEKLFETEEPRQPVLSEKLKPRQPVVSEKSEIVSRFSRMYDDQVMTREEQIRTSVLLPTQQGLHGEKVISKEAQQLLTQNDLDFMLHSRELRESIKSGVITPHLAKLLKERRDQGEDGDKDSLFDDDEDDEFDDDDEDTAKRALESQQLHNKLIYYYSKHEPAKLRDSQAIDRLVEIGKLMTFQDHEKLDFIHVNYRHAIRHGCHQRRTDTKVRRTVARRASCSNETTRSEGSCSEERE